MWAEYRKIVSVLYSQSNLHNFSVCLKKMLRFYFMYRSIDCCHYYYLWKNIRMCVPHVRSELIQSSKKSVSNKTQKPKIIQMAWNLPFRNVTPKIWFLGAIFGNKEVKCLKKGKIWVRLFMIQTFSLSLLCMDKWSLFHILWFWYLWW